MFTKDSDRVQELKETAESGGDWYIAPPDIEAEQFTFIIAADPFGIGSWTAYDVTFDYPGSNTATFVVDVSSEEATSPASSSPIGWLDRLGRFRLDRRVVLER